MLGLGLRAFGNLKGLFWIGVFLNCISFRFLPAEASTPLRAQSFALFCAKETCRGSHFKYVSPSRLLLEFSLHTLNPVSGCYPLVFLLSSGACETCVGCAGEPCVVLVSLLGHACERLLLKKTLATVFGR